MIRVLIEVEGAGVGVEITELDPVVPYDSGEAGRAVARLANRAVQRAQAAIDPKPHLQGADE